MPLTLALTLLPLLSTAAANAVGTLPCKVSEDAVAALPDGWEDSDVFDAEVSLLQVNSELKRDVRHTRDGARASRTSALQLGSSSSSADALRHQRLEGGITALYTSLRCSVVLVAQFMVLYAFSLLVKLRDELSGRQRGTGQSFVEKLHANSGSIPLVLVTVVLMHVRAEQLSKISTPWAYGIPQWWAEAGLVVAALAGVIALAFQMLSLVSGHQENGPRNMASNFFAGCQSLSSGVQYLGLGVMVVAALFMVEPYDVWLDNGHIGISGEIACFTNIVIQIFVLNSVLLVASGIRDLATGSSGVDFVVKLATAGSKALQQGPMLCILIAAARLRAMDVKPAADMAQDSADVLCYLGAHALLVHMVLACALAAVEPAAGAKPGEAQEQRSFGVRALGMLSGLAMLCVYVSVVGLFVYIFALSGPGGWKASPEFTAVLACVMVLAAQHFGVEIVTFLGGILKGRQASRGSRAMSALARASEMNAVAPVLSSLFLLAGARAGEFGAQPQGWMQLCMYGCIVLSALALLLAIGLLVLTEGSSSGEGGEPARPRAGAHLLAFVQVLSVAGLYALMISILCGLFSMSASNVRT